MVGMERLARSVVLAVALVGTCGFTARAQSLDLSQLVESLPRAYLGKGIKVGYRVETRRKVGSSMLNIFTAVVGETEDTWEVESNEMTAGVSHLPGGKGLVMAMVVDKRTLKVLSAWIGPPGKELKRVKVMKPGKSHPRKTEAVEKHEDLLLPSGKKARAKIVSGRRGIQIWVGAKGTDLEGLTLATRRGKVHKKLRADPTEVQYALEDKTADGKARTVLGRKLVYTNGDEVVWSKDPVAVCMSLNGLLASKSKGKVDFKVVSLRTDARKTLVWK